MNLDRVQKLIDRYLGCCDGELRMGGLSVSALAEKYGTPCFIYDGGALEKKWQLLRSTLPERFSISYSMKANPNVAIIRFFLRKGCGLEIASAGEFQRALEAGCAPEDIVYAGPGKTEAELELVLASGIGEIHLESFLEMQRVRGISGRLGVPARVAVRVNPSAEAQGGAMRMGGKPAPFGVDEEVLDAFLDQLLADANLDFRGIHIFAGTQILDHEVLIAQYRKAVAIAKRVATRCGRPLHTADLGGGLGIPYFAEEQELDMEQMRLGLAELLAEIESEPLLAGTNFMVEPGRYLVGEGGVYLTRVNDIKVSRGKKFLVVDGGMHHHLAASGNLGQVIRRSYPVAVVNKLTASAKEVVDVVGPLCTPLDVLARGVELPYATVGDLVGIFQSGAYARSASPMEFLSHPSPPEIWVEAGRDYLVQPRGSQKETENALCRTS